MFQKPVEESLKIQFFWDVVPS